GDEEYIREFAGASIESFSEFSEHFKIYLLAREMDNLKRAGHKIKPVAQMLHLEPVMETYEHSKQLLEQNASTEDLADQADKMSDFCNRVIVEFKDLQ
ncbi:MAG: taurine dioxygenase, partial [Balneolaceae bacterium]